MYGVFNAYEKQVIYDWIAGTALETLPKLERLGALVNRTSVNHLLANNKVADTIATLDFNHENQAHEKSLKAKPSNIVKMELGKKHLSSQTNDFKALNKFAPVRELNMTEDKALFNNKVAKTKDRSELMQLLTEWMSPAKHHTHLGLIATQLYIEQLNTAR